MQDTAENKYAVTGWKRKSGDNSFDFILPSGQTCRLKKLSMETIAEMGLMDDLDTFTGAVLPTPPSKKAKGKGAKVLTEEEQNGEVMKSMLKNKEAFLKMLATVNRVVIGCVLEPQVLPEPAAGEDRDEELVYIDDIDFEDKMLIFAEVFDGMSKFESFRARQSDVMGTMAEVTSAAVPSERPAEPAV